MPESKITESVANQVYKQCVGLTQPLDLLHYLTEREQPVGCVKQTKPKTSVSTLGHTVHLRHLR